MAPQLDINGMALAIQSIEKTGTKTIALRMQQGRRSYEVNRFRQRHPKLVARREQEVQLLERHIGKIPVSELLPNSEKELVEYRRELVRRLGKLPEVTFHSLQELVQRHRDPAAPFTFADFDFIHAPGGHAPKLSYEPSVRLLTGNGPQAIDQQTANLRMVAARLTSGKQLTK